jgi:hypothetical protein
LIGLSTLDNNNDSVTLGYNVGAVKFLIGYGAVAGFNVGDERHITTVEGVSKNRTVYSQG